jgi:dynein heavy chain 2
LNVAGGLIQQERQANNKYDEAELLIKSIRINTLSKLTHSDNSRFKRLLDDIFPGVTKSDVKFIELEEAIDAVIKEMGYQSIDK